MITRFLIAIIFISLAGCNKDKFNTVPQIEFKSITPNVFYSDNINPFDKVFLKLQLTDAEGDFGVNGKDTSFVYVRNVTLTPLEVDSFMFPDLSNVKSGNLNVEISVNVDRALATSGRPNYTDTLFFEVYVKDFARNKSNVIVTPEPLYFITP